MAAVEVPAEQDAKAGTRAAAALFDDLQAEAREGDGVVLADGALLLAAEDLLERPEWIRA
jgi:hypothetical protein